MQAIASAAVSSKSSRPWSPLVQAQKRGTTDDRLRIALVIPVLFKISMYLE
jgi:hypothetical protein